MIHHYILSGNNTLIKVLKNKEGIRKRGNPYREINSGKFVSHKKKLDKSVNMYIYDCETGRNFSKEEFDDYIAGLFFKNIYKENEEDK
jgi:hypothetical protein